MLISSTGNSPLPSVKITRPGISRLLDVVAIKNFQRFTLAAAGPARVLGAGRLFLRAAAIPPPSRSAVVADGFDGAALLGLLALGFLLRRAGCLQTKEYPPSSLRLKLLGAVSRQRSQSMHWLST